MAIALALRLGGVVSPRSSAASIQLSRLLAERRVRANADWLEARRFAHRFDESPHFLRVFSAGLGFDAARHIHRVRFHGAHGLADVLWRQPTRENQRYAPLHIAEQAPRRIATRASELRG